MARKRTDTSSTFDTNVFPPAPTTRDKARMKKADLEAGFPTAPTEVNVPGRVTKNPPPTWGPGMVNTLAEKLVLGKSRKKKR